MATTRCAPVRTTRCLRRAPLKPRPPSESTPAALCTGSLEGGARRGAAGASKAKPATKAKAKPAAKANGGKGGKGLPTASARAKAGSSQDDGKFTLGAKAGQPKGGKGGEGGKPAKPVGASVELCEANLTALVTTFDVSAFPMLLQAPCLAWSTAFPLLSFFAGDFTGKF